MSLVLDVSLLKNDDNYSYVSLGSFSECEEGDVRIFNVTYSYSTDGEFVTGIPQTCVLGAWSSLCDDISVPHYTAELVCSDNGYQSMRA